MTEVWETIPAMSRYQISSAGRIRMRSGRIHRSHYVRGGYERVGLICLDGQQRNFLVHRLVALAFIGPCPDGMEVNHKNGLTSDNRLENLEYVTPKANAQHSIQVLGRRRASGEGHGMAVLTAERVRRLRQEWASGRWPTKRRLAVAFGITEYTCGDVLNGKTWRSVA